MGFFLGPKKLRRGMEMNGAAPCDFRENPELTRNQGIFSKKPPLMGILTIQINR